MTRTLWIALVVAGCGGDGKADSADGTPIDPLSFPVDQPGPYNAGYRTWTTTYEVFGESRTIPLNVWYPTDSTAGNPVTYIGMAPDDLSFGDAVPVPPVHAGGYPLLVYSHGHQGFGGTSSDLMRWFASHGWVAVAPDHVGNLLNENPDDEDPRFDAFRPLDLIAAVDAMAALPDDDPLGKTITDRYVLSGHSRGCTTVWSLLGATYDPSNPADYCDGCDADTLATFSDGSLADDRAIGGLPLGCGYSSGTYGDGYAAVTEPVLSLTGSADGNRQSVLDGWDRIQGIDYTWVELEGACHQTFALGTCSTFPADEGFAIVDTYSLAFARRHLLADEGQDTVGILDGTIDVDPRATLQAK